MDIRDVPGFELQTPIRWGNSAPGKAEHDTGERAPRKNHARRPHGDAPRHAHAGPKKSGGGRREGGGKGQQRAGAGAGQRRGGGGNGGGRGRGQGGNGGGRAS
ncbi:hypothetical protein G6F51_014313 [Rhizopus arrhizus]|uniref:Uncharacterized protein n=1 Tax=Rhizopus oryzae TaxID=64495 RepID=A0A9P6XN19_RHIOR|nr:hypothetical protein G6F51_014313 [Rhizopus arrhizus]